MCVTTVHTHTHTYVYCRGGQYVSVCVGGIVAAGYEPVVDAVTAGASGPRWRRNPTAATTRQACRHRSVRQIYIYIYIYRSLNIYIYASLTTVMAPDLCVCVCVCTHAYSRVLLARSL